jgi:uncharacterized phage protein (TIGR02218 family)
MKTLVPGLASHIADGLTTLCFCWKLIRRDGTVMGFTNHDEAVTFAGVTYEASTGFTSSEIQSSLGLAVDNTTAMGALSADAITEDDLAAGLYDDADVELWRVNWGNPSERVLLRKANTGELQRGKQAFQAELRGLAHRLNQPTGRAYTYGCDADLGDARCGVDLEAPAFKGTGAVTTVLAADRVIQASGLGAFAEGWFSRGKIAFTSGANAGLAMEVKRHTAGATIELWQAMPYAIVNGDNFTITAGCDKQWSGDCKTKFANRLNFRGHPHMPGPDAVTSYPNTGDNLDGGSLNA